MERETKTVTTPAGFELVIKTSLSAGERNAIRGVLLEDMRIDPANFKKDDKTDAVTGLDKVSGAILAKQEKVVIENLVVSYKGKTDGIFAELENGTPEEYDFVVAELNKVTAPKKA